MYQTLCGIVCPLNDICYLQKTTLSVLDCMIDQHTDGDSARAYYHVLEADESGRPPDDPLFKKKDWSAFQVIAKRGDKVL